MIKKIILSAMALICFVMIIQTLYMLTVKIEKDISLVKACTGGYLQMTC
jgi:hypothetical protein